jgi:hypothetical protein
VARGKPDQSGDASGDAGASEVQEKMDVITEQGFRGVEVDPTPNENYTVAGVTSGAPTPETDADAEAEARKSLGAPFAGTGPIASQQAAEEDLEQATVEEDRNRV